MVTTFTNFGDNLGVQFPKSLLKNVHISENDDVEIIVDENSIIIKRKEGKKKHLTTNERIAAFSESIEDAQLSEIDWGKPRGKEIW